LSRHYDLELSDEPDFLFFSHFGTSFLDYDVPRVFFCSENLRPDFNLADYALGFDRLSFGDRYFRFPIYCHDRHRELRELDQDSRKVESARKEFCNYIYSNPGPDPTRTLFFEKLSLKKAVVSAGKHLNNTGFLVRDKTAFQRKFKFTIAFENSSTSGYTTEKILDAFIAGTVPIYWGDPDVCQDFNPQSFINVHSFSSLDAAVDEVLRIDSDDAAYQAMVREPVFRHRLPSYGVEGDLEAFLKHIFDQDPAQAIRRNRVFWGRAYEVQRQKAAYFLSQVESDKLFSLVHHYRMWGARRLWESFSRKAAEKALVKKQRNLPWQ
jgi:hypothetical protein